MLDILFKTFTVIPENAAYCLGWQITFYREYIDTVWVFVSLCSHKQGNSLCKNMKKYSFKVPFI